MLYTTRNPKDATKVIDSLPFSENEKEELRSYLPILSDFMKEIKSKKNLNSKGGERWFSERINGKLVESEEILSRFFSGQTEDLRGMAAKFLFLQATVLTETVKLGRELDMSARNSAHRWLIANRGSCLSSPLFLTSAL